MASAKEISNRIKSIKDTMKITKAMYMMSSMKLRKARAKLDNTEPYFYGLQKQITEILLHFPDIEHIFFDNRSEDKTERAKKKAIIVITGDKGMAGAYNHNVIKETSKLLKEYKDNKLFVVGEVGRHYFAGLGYDVEDGFPNTASNPTIHRARVMTEIIVELYKNEEIDSVDVVYTRMVNSMKEEVEVTQILPLKTKEFLKKEMVEKLGENVSKDEEYVIFPSPENVIENVAYNYVTGFLYGALVEASASEENARMMAMQSATDNAEAMLHDLSIEFNRVRQAAITQEITEVIGGAKALKKKKEKAKAQRKALMQNN